MPRLNDEQRAYTRRLGARIRKRRVALDWSIKVLAFRAELSWPRVWEYEHGRILPGLAVLERIAGALDIPVECLTSERYLRKDDA